MATKQKHSTLFYIFVFVISFVIGFVLIVGTMYFLSLPSSYEIPGKIQTNGASANVGELDVEVIKNNDLSIHFMELGNKYTGDSTYIKCGDVDMLIDAGSRTSSVSTISNYINNYCTDGVLEYVIVTHAHQDHYAGFATSEKVDSLFDLYKVNTIIEFAKTNNSSSAMYKNYIRERDNAQNENGDATTVYTALECYNETDGAQKIYNLSEYVTLEILYQRFYEEKASSENDYSVCAMINQTSINGEEKHYLFTGDLEEDGEESLVENNNLPQVDVYKAGHHGSKTSTSELLMSVIRPKVVCVCCCAGSSEYTSKNENQFPTQIFIDNIAPYTDQVYVTTLCVDYKNGQYTSMNGNIVVTCNYEDILVTVSCSNNNTILKDTEWFKDFRIMPEEWAS